jgi:dienelactone hydrolase
MQLSVPRMTDGSAAAVALAAAPLLALAAGLAWAEPLASWSFDDDPPGVARDSGPAHLDGRVAGPQYVPGRDGHGRALSFAADGATVDFPAYSAFAFDGSASFAVSFWVRTSQADGFASVVMAKDRPGGGVGFSFCLGRRPGAISFEVWSWGRAKLIGRGSIADGKWHRVVGAYDAASERAFLAVDGAVEATAAVGRGGPKLIKLRLGDNVDSHQPFRGELDDVSIESGLPGDLSQQAERQSLWQLLTDEEVAAAQQAWLDRTAAPRFYQARTSREWKERAAQVRRHVLESLGLWPLPERLPLKVHYAGSIEHKAYTLRRVYWQTWPGYYASGWLYMPKKASFPAPAVLCPHGHWENGARHPVVQARCIGLATKGYVVLAADSVHVYNWSAGLVPLTAMTWNNIRGIDLLCSLPEVDPKRLGCTGCSGGAQQTFYLMAVEDRIDVAIPVCMVSEFRRILFTTWAHCTCNHVPGLLAATDTPEMTACFAPRPSLIITVTGDWTAWTKKEVFPEIKGVYDLFRAGGKTVCTEYDWGHDYSLPMREEAYAFLNKYLKGIEDPAEAKEPAHTPETLEAMNALDGPPAGALGPETAAVELVRRMGFDATTPGRGIRARLDGIRRSFMALTHEAGVRDGAAVRAVGEPKTVDGLRVERVVLTSEKETLVPAVVLTAARSRAQGRPAVLLLSPGGKADLLATRWGLAKALVAKGMVVCAADVRPYGELGANREPLDMDGVVVGRPELALGAHDARRVCAYLRTRPDVDPAQVAVVGFGEAGPMAIAAGVYDSKIAAVAALDIGDTYAARDRLPRCPRILTVGDLPQLAAALAPRPVWVAGAAQPKAFDWTAQAYAQAKAAGGFRLTASADDAEVVAWLERAGR